MCGAKGAFMNLFADYPLGERLFALAVLPLADRSLAIKKNPTFRKHSTLFVVS
jgi:hypothetical protein